ncbi:hypothetical protein EV182_003321 [Spiromyces aspiralis]|uniref:Uncharacterized protein n=1 Tax=Spiromyces aspiralis TaxID=68401 RepID=A0ACC1HTY0_9FUNG|nr:hypothetical protein EV182_003321 [Spiromyces aspiralis]
MSKIASKLSKSGVANQVSKLVTAHRKREGGGFIVRRSFPGHHIDMVDPFLMIDHLGPVEYGPGEAIGAPDHPHRGFETVTYIIEGEWQHKDSQGNSGNLKTGDVQWMSAASGVVHSEMPSERMYKEGGRFHGFQIWVNLPARAKMSRPKYQDVDSKDIPYAYSKDGLTSIKVIAGKAEGVLSTISTHTPIYMFDLRMKPGAEPYLLRIPREMNAVIYNYDTQDLLVGIEERVVGESQLARLDLSVSGIKGTAAGEPGKAEEEDDDSNMQVVPLRLPEGANKPAGILVLAGVPLNEEVARYGPFVMNTDEELYKAIRDFQTGQFGKIDGEEERYRQTQEARKKDSSKQL